MQMDISHQTRCIGQYHKIQTTVGGKGLLSSGGNGLRQDLRNSGQVHHDLVYPRHSGGHGLGDSLNGRENRVFERCVGLGHLYGPIRGVCAK